METRHCKSKSFDSIDNSFAEGHAKRFECQECDKILNSKEALKYHQNSVHEGIRFPCDHCNYKATTRQGLKNHESNKHINQ